MSNKTGNTSALWVEAEQTIKDADYKQQLLGELLGQLKQPSNQLTAVDTYGIERSPLASARALIAERGCQLPEFNHALENTRYRRPLLLRGIVI